VAAQLDEQTMLSNEDTCVVTVLDITYFSTYKIKCINAKKVVYASR
jgi:hypothetical protein